MNIIQTIVMAVIEGLTEFLPISSTGHMVIVQNMMGINSTDFVKAFTIIIQFGAILSVVVVYWKHFFTSWAFYGKLLLGIVPMTILGFLFIGFINSFLENVWVVAIMLIVGGILMLFVDKWFEKKNNTRDITYKNAFVIGVFQCIAMIPGVSRSMATIVGGMTQGLSRKAAAEFSFFLAVPTMMAASSYKLLKLLLAPDGVQVVQQHMPIMVTGIVVAFIVALFAIRFFVKFVTRHGFKFFGYYRIILGSIILLLLLTGNNLEIL